MRKGRFKFTAGSASLKSSTTPRFDWMDVVKGLAIGFVLLHHFPAVATGFSLRLSETGVVTSLQHQWSLSRSVTTNPVDSCFAFLSTFGYQGVHLFLIVSGFGLAIADIRRGRRNTYASFIRRRALRLLPPYWMFCLIIGFIGFVQSRFHAMPLWIIGSSRWDLLCNLLLTRDFREKWVWSYPGSLWFVPLILRLYLLYPLLARGIERFPRLTLVIALGATLAYRAVAVLLLDSGPVGTTGPYERSTPLMFCFARLFEFTFGIWLGASTASGRIDAFQQRGGWLVAVCGLAIWAAGTASACYRLGFIICDPLIAVGLFCWIFQVSRAVSTVKMCRPVFIALGRRSYSVYLMHAMLISTPLAFSLKGYFLAKFLLFCTASFILALILDAALFCLHRIVIRCSTLVKQTLGLRIATNLAGTASASKT
jgi:peptidoglycan/LPS O-acetylase OafA/YrhL